MPTTTCSRRWPWPAGSAWHRPCRPKGGGGMNGRIPAPASAESVGAISNQGGKITSLYNPANGDVSIMRASGNSRTQLILSDNGYMYRVLNGDAFVLFDQGSLPWGGETVTAITAEMLSNCTSHEWGNCIVTQRCGFAIVSLSGIELAAGIRATIRLPYISRARCQTWMPDLGAAERGALIYIDDGDDYLVLHPPAAAIVAGYFTLIYPIQ